MPASTSPAIRTGLTKSQTRQTLGSFVLSTALRAAFDSTCGNATLVFAAFALAVGVAKERMGLIASLAFAACLLQLASIGLNRRLRDKKTLIVSASIIEAALMIIAVLVVPLLPGGWRLAALCVVSFMAAGALHMAKPVYDEWIASSIPVALRGPYLSRRTQILTLVSTPMPVALGYLVGILGKENTLGLAILMAIGGLFGIAAAIPLRHASVPAQSERAEVDWADVPAVLAHKPFRRFLIAGQIITLPFFFSVPYYQVFHLEVVGMSSGMIGVMLAGYAVVKVCVLPIAGRKLIRLGPRRMMTTSGFIYVGFFALYVMSARWGAPAVIAAWALAALGDAIWGVAYSAANYAVTPNSRARPAFFAVANLMTHGSYALGAMVSSLGILEWLRDKHLTLGDLELDQFHIYFLGCGLLMAPCALAGRLFVGRREARGR